MGEILGKAKTVREVLKEKYMIDYYQREYKWTNKQMGELIDDLSGKFLEEYQSEHERTKVEEYAHYFLGSIIISKKNNASFIVDGQQRLTSLTLLLILLRNLQQGRDDQVNVDDLIISERFGRKSFNLNIEERNPLMEALFDGEIQETNDQPESIQNIIERYHYIEEYFPEELIGQPLPYFIDWLLENVHVVEITAYSDDDAYTIFETMNDRGLSLSPTEMLKGYLLANITDASRREEANRIWRTQIKKLNEAGKDVGADFFKTWFRSQYSQKIRERKKGAIPEDFDRMGTEFHRWLRDESGTIDLNNSKDFFQFISRNFAFYGKQYLKFINAAKHITPGLEHIMYNSDQGFTLQYLLLLAPLDPEDSDGIVNQKARLVSCFLDILLTWRLWNFRSIAYSTMQYAMFIIMRDIRGLAPTPLAEKLYEYLKRERETFESNDRLRVHKQNRYAIHRIMARITDYIGTRSGDSSRYPDYVDTKGNDRFEIEHIWANHYEDHAEEFEHQNDFAEYRNRIGGLLLLRRSFNASYGDLPYEEKLVQYNTNNLLARSLNPACYEHNPRFSNFLSQSKLPFRSHETFKKADLDERSELYKKIAEQVWNPESLLKEVED